MQANDPDPDRSAVSPRTGDATVFSVVAWQHRGEIIRWWRNDVLGLSQQHVADRLAIRPTALSNWELGSRAISIDFEHLDKALEGSGVLAGLLWGFGTPQGLEPVPIWSKTFPGPSTPVWMWIRSAAPEVKVAAEWGMFGFQATFRPGAGGVFVTVGASVAESPVLVLTSAPCWIDFGRGQLPAIIPEAQLHDAIEMAQPSTASGAFADMFAAQMADQMASSHGSQVADLYRRAPERTATFFNRYTSAKRTEPSPPTPVPGGLDAVERLRFATLRQARGLSLAQTAERLVTTTGAKVSRDTLRRFENSTGEPHDRLLPVALDHVLGAGGKLTITELRTGTGSGSVQIPSYWRSPVWIELAGPPDTPAPELHWGSWRRPVDGSLPQLLVSHHAEPGAPLRIKGHPHLRWSVGVGCRLGAVPINHGWIPISVDAANRALTEAGEAVLEAVRRGTEPPSS